MHGQSAKELDAVGGLRREAIDRAPLFGCLAAEEREQLAAVAEMACVEPGQQIVAEGTAPGALFVIASGQVEIARRQLEAGGARHALRVLGPGETFGELALLEDLPASASVYAATATTLLVIPLAELRRRMAQHGRFEPLFRGLAEQLNSRLRSLTDVTVRALEREVVELRARVAIGSLLIGVVAVLSVFAYSLSLGAQLTAAGWHQPIVLVVCTLGLVVMAIMIRGTGLPLSFWGFTTRNWRAAVRDALGYSAVVVGLLLSAKWIAIHTVPGWRDQPLFALTALIGSGDRAALWEHVAQLAVYVAIAVPLQEIVIRGCVQSALQEFLTGPQRALWAIVTSNLIFSVTHSYLSPQFALVVLLPGFFWGWLYYRERTLIAPILSHAIIGAAAMDIIGILTLLR